MTEEKVSLVILYILPMIVPYFLPWFVASSRGHYNTTAPPRSGSRPYCWAGRCSAGQN